MMTLSILIMMSLVITSVLLLLSLATSEKSTKEREKMTPFECGFAPLKKSRSPFSMRFFMITLIFLIFDMEVSLVLPMGVLMETTSQFVWVSTVLIVIFVLVAGLFHEWKNGALSWV
nr:NADH dehydrogenase subunit 3 [Cyamus boopis]